VTRDRGLEMTLASTAKQILSTFTNPPGQVPTDKMFLSATLIFAALSFSVVAIPVSHSGVAIPLTKRMQVRDANGVVDVATLHRNALFNIAKIHQGFQTYEQNTGTRHPSAPKVKLSDKRSLGIKPLFNYEAGYWYGSISVGTPAQSFTVDVDTGSGDLYLASSACDKSCNKHDMYDASASSTAHDLRTPFYLEYGDGSTVNGTLYTDDITIAGYTAKKQTLGAAHHINGDFNGTQFLPDGLLGLAFPSMSAYGDSPLFQTLVAQGSLPANSFGMYLSQNYSELYLAGRNNKLYKGDFTYVPVTHEGYWQTQFEALYFHNKKIASISDAVIDSGTTMILGNRKAVQAFYHHIPGSAPLKSGLYSIPCSFNSSILFQFGATNFTIQPGTFNIGTVSDGSSDCVGGIAANDGFDFWVLGDVFLQNV